MPVAIEQPCCKLCGGNAGRLSPEGSHYLCESRARLGLPTPCLGMRCKKCGGRGWWREDGGPSPALALPVYFDPGEAARGIAAIFPPCSDCGGKGHN